MQDNPYNNISPKDFIEKYLITSTPDESEILVCAKPENPKAGKPWLPSILSGNPDLPSNNNLYICISTCRPIDDENDNFYGHYRARLTSAVATHFFMLDDLGDDTTAHKPNHQSLPLKPTWLIQTSPHNYQAFYVLTEPLKDINLSNRITKQLPGQVKADKAAVNAVRWARLPGGINNKPEHISTEYPDGYPVHVAEGDPATKYSYQQIIEAFELEMGEQLYRTQAIQLSGVEPEGWARHMSCLQAIDPDCDYDTWFGVATVLHAWDERGLEEFCEWSSHGSKFVSVDDCIAKFNQVSYDCRNPQNNQTVRSYPWLEAVATKQYGWSYNEYSAEQLTQLTQDIKQVNNEIELLALADKIHDAFLTAPHLESITTTFHAKLKEYNESSSLPATRALLKDAQIDAEAETWSYHLTDEGNLQRFRKLNQDTFYHVPELKQFMYWDQSKWVFANNAQDHAIKTIEQIPVMEERALNDAERKALHKWRMACGNYTRINNLCRLISNDKQMTKSLNDMNLSKHKLGTPQQVYNLETGTISAPNPNHFITMHTGTNFDEDAKCPRWKQFILEIMNGNADMARYMQKLAGYSMFGGNPEQLFVILSGNGANGKSTFVQTLALILKDYAATASPDTLMRPSMTKTAGAAAPDLVDLFRKRLVICNEWDENKYINEALVKALTGSTDAIKVRSLYSNSYIEYVPEFLIMLATNHQPNIAGMDYGIWRRMLLIPFEVNFDNHPNYVKDIHLADYFRTKEAAGIFKWMVEGYRIWRQEGMSENIPDKLLHIKAEYKREMDTIGAFISEMCLTTNDYDNPASPQAQELRCQSTELYDSYKHWCKRNGNAARAMRTFSIAIKERGFKKVRVANVNGFKGIRPLSTAEITILQQQADKEMFSKASMLN